MKIILLFLMMIGNCGLIAQEKTVIPNVVTQTISREDLKKTLEHVLRLSREQQIELDSANLQNEQIKVDLAAAQDAHINAQINADSLQKEVNAVTDDRNTQAKEKDKALTDRDYWHQKQQDAVGKLWFWRFVSLGLVSAIGLFIYLKKFTTLGASLLKFI